MVLELADAALVRMPPSRIERMSMADDSERALKVHESTYNSFTALMKWGAIICLIIGFLIILVIRN
jgi:hypothetical protein